MFLVNFAAFERQPQNEYNRSVLETGVIVQIKWSSV